MKTRASCWSRVQYSASHSRRNSASRQRATAASMLIPHGLPHNHLLDLCPQLIVGQRAGMVHSDLSPTIEQHQRGCGRGSVDIEVVFTDWHRHIEKPAVEAMAHCVDVAEFVAW